MIDREIDVSSLLQDIQREREEQERDEGQAEKAD